MILGKSFPLSVASSVKWAWSKSIEPNLFESERVFFSSSSSSFLWPHLQHMKVPRLGAESELQLPAYATDPETLDPSCICSLHSSCGNMRPLTHWVRPGMVPASSWGPYLVLNPLSHNRNFMNMRGFFFFFFFLRSTHFFNALIF